MDIDRYIATNAPAWERLRQLTARAQRGVGGLSPAELEELVRLYQRAAGHLSYARTFYQDAGLTARLSSLVIAAGAVVYGTRARTLRVLGRFLALTFPAAVWHLRYLALTATVLTAVPAAIVAAWIATSPAALEVASPAAERAALLQEFEDYYASEEAAQFSSSVFTNNVLVAGRAFAFGVAFCLPTVLVLLANAANLGVAWGIFAAVGQQPRFWGLILPHGLLELTAIFIAGAAGLKLGWALIDPGDRPRGQALAEEGRRAVAVVLGLVLAFLVAAVIEGFVTGQPWPTWLRVGIGVLAEAAFLAWIVLCGRRAAAQGLTGAIGELDRGWLQGGAAAQPGP